MTEREKEIRMDHREATKYIYTFLDGELSGEESLSIERHIDSCKVCQRFISYETKLNSVIKRSTLKEKTSPHLRKQIVDEIEKIENKFIIRIRFEFPAQLRPLFSLMLAGLMFLGIVSGFFFYKWQRTIRDSTIFSQLAGKHIVFALQEDPVEITRSDAEELIDWFKDKVNFAVSVPLFSEGPDLLGARLSELHQKGAVHLIYQRGECRISFFTFKSMTKDFYKDHKREYEGKDCYITRYKNQLIFLWRGQGEIAFALVSDEEEELYELASLIM